MLDTPRTIHSSIENLDKLLMPTKEELEEFENEDFSYLDDED